MTTQYRAADTKAMNASSVRYSPVVPSGKSSASDFCLRGALRAWVATRCGGTARTNNRSWVLARSVTCQSPTPPPVTHSLTHPVSPAQVTHSPVTPTLAGVVLRGVCVRRCLICFIYNRPGRAPSVPGRPHLLPLESLELLAIALNLAVSRSSGTASDLVWTVKAKGRQVQQFML
jgi:hypothetical protein